MGEIWRQVNIDEFRDCYDISNLGRIRRSMPGMGTIANKILKPNLDGSGYFTIDLCNKPFRKRIKIAKLVAITFLKKPEGNVQINHKKGIRKDDRSTELEWVTASENVLHAYRVLKRKIVKGEEIGSSVLDNSKIIKIKKLLEKGMSQRRIAQIFNVGKTTIQEISAGVTWKHIKSGCGLVR